MRTLLKAISLVSYLLVGAASAIVGLAPWLITGMRLPLQNLWAVDTSPAEMPVTLLPFSQYALALIVAVIVTGSAIAGGLARATRAKRPRFALVAIVVGALAIQLVALAQTTVTVSNGLRESTAAAVYLVMLVAGSLASIMIGQLVLLLIARAPKSGAVIGMSVAGIALSTWLEGIVLPFGTVSLAPNLVLLDAIRWVPAVVVGVAVAWCGLGTIGRVSAAIVSLLVLWIGPAAVTAVTSAAGSRVLAPYPSDMVDYGAQVFVSALGVAGGSLSLLVVAVIVMALGLAARWAIRRRRPERASAA